MNPCVNPHIGLTAGSECSWLGPTMKLLFIAANCAFKAYEDTTDGPLSQCVKFKEPVHYKETKSQEVAGFVAILEEDKLIVMSFRGTDGAEQLWTQIGNARSYRVPFEGGGLVLDYVVYAYEALEPHVEKALDHLESKYPDYELLITGHSLGGSLAQLAACSISKKKLFPMEKIRLISLGMPRIGDKDHVDAVHALVPFSLRVTNKFDVVPLLPPWLYHAGCKLVIEQSFWEFCINHPLAHHRKYLGFSTR